MNRVGLRWWLVAMLVGLCASLASPALCEAPARASDAAGGDSDERQSKKSRATRKRSTNQAKARAKKKRRRRPRSTGYTRLDTPWHKPGTPDDCEGLSLAQAGSWGLMSLGAKTCFIIPPLSEGDIPEATKQDVRMAFVDKRRGTVKDVHPRLLHVIERAVREFDVPYVHLISGYRPGRAASRHAHGLAADVVFPGVTNKRLAEFLRQQGFMGVGIYMRTGFVHMDIRERSYFWLDWSPPGVKWRGKPMLMKQAKEADDEAMMRGDAPFDEPEALQKAVARRRARQARAAAARARRRAAAEAAARNKRKAEAELTRSGQ